MADFNPFGGRINTCTPSVFVVLMVVITSVLASICPDNQYLNAHRQTCMNCTECWQGMVVLRPCEPHRDTHCGPISDLSNLLVKPRNPHRHHHEKYNLTKYQHKKHGSEKSGGEPSTAALQHAASFEAPFSSAETLVWDWQAIALTSGIFACVLFFFVITLYSLHQARQWRRLKENFEADVEELSARLSLMAATSAEKCEFLEDDGAGFAAGSTGDPNYLNTRCVYLEQLLSERKEDEKNCNSKPKGNVYIEENKTKK